MHPEIWQDMSGRCPQCGMALVLADMRGSLASRTPAPDRGLGALTWQSYLPLATIVSLILLSCIVLSWSDYQVGQGSLLRFVAYFMTGFFLVFSGFKLLDLKGFAHGYAMYDLLAQRFFSFFMRRQILLLLAIIGTAGIIWLGVFAWRNLRGIGPAFAPPPADIARFAVENKTGLPLKLPEGFSIEIFAKDLPGARVMAFDSAGNLWISRTGEGIIMRLDVRNGRVFHQEDVLTGLRKSHGLVFDPDNARILYYAEENRISYIDILSGSKPQKIIDLPVGGNHFIRTIGFGPDRRLYVAIGSTCNVCHESDARRAAIYSLNKDGSDFKIFARGLRNAVFFAWHPETKKMWATEMGRDLLGDDMPPDEVNIIEEGKNYGWPICYGKNIHDAVFDSNTYIRNPCMEPFETESVIDIPAHSAPLGLVFIPESWPTGYRGNLLVAYHGSWNRSAPTGYKIVRIKFDAAGAYQSAEDFISGWLTAGNRALGRPVDLVFGPDHALYVSDDKAGVIYRITPSKAR